MYTYRGRKREKRKRGTEEEEEEEEEVMVKEDGAGARWKFTSSSVARFRVGAEVEDPRRALPLRPVAILLSRT